MSIWALADLHLSFGVPEKSMEYFGAIWKDYAHKIQRHWKELVKPSDLVLIPGDISWAKTLEEAKLDLEWIDQLPGTKLLLKGNHDYWWPSSSKLKKNLPPSLHFIHNNAFNWGDVSIGGSRLWDSEEYSFKALNQRQPNLRAQKEEDKPDPKILQREWQRLRLSLQHLNPKAKHKIAMTHYPPIGADLTSSFTSQIFEEFGVNIVVFGHLHSLNKPSKELFGYARGIKYILASVDTCDFTPVLIL